MNLVDFSFSHPTIAQLKQAKVDGVIRYLSDDPAKAITLAEASRLHAADIPYALVYEDQAEDFTSPARALTKARIASSQLAALEKMGLFAPDRPVYCAVDGNLQASRFLSTWLAISAFAAALKRPSGVYGPRPFLLFAEQKGCRYLFESAAASWNTGPEPRKTLQQLVVVPDGCGPLAGVDWDVNLQEDWGQFPFTSPTPTPEVPMFLVHTTTNQWWLVSGERKEPMTPEQLVSLKAEGIPTKPLTDAEVAALETVPQGTF